MKLDILILDVALVAIVFLPYVLFILIGRREERILTKKFLEEASKSQLQIEEMDSWNTTIVGLDKKNFKILLVQKRKKGVAVELLDLKNVRGCEVLQESHSVKMNNRNGNILQRVDLEMKLFNNLNRTVNFYNCEDSPSQDYEMKHAERWCSKINDLVRFHPTVNSAA